MKNYQYVCVMKGLNKSYPNKEVLKNVWLSFLPGAKIGVIGHNGSGKSTILKIIAGIDKEFTGEAWIAEGIKAGYLPQEPQLDSSKRPRPAASGQGIMVCSCCASTTSCPTSAWLRLTAQQTQHTLM